MSAYCKAETAWKSYNGLKGHAVEVEALIKFWRHIIAHEESMYMLCIIKVMFLWYRYFGQTK